MTTARFDRSFYIPKGATAVDSCGDSDAAVYVYEMTASLYALGFHGKASKPDWHHRFRTVEQRDKHIADYIEGRKARSAMMAERAAARKKPHSLKVGDILSASWGYDQTNIDFYKVTKVLGKRMVEIVEIGQKLVRDGDGYDKVVADPEVVTGAPKRKLVSEYGVKVRNWGVWASKWDGNARYQTALGCGH